jgi:hypothetical protein
MNKAYEENYKKIEVKVLVIPGERYIYKGGNQTTIRKILEVLKIPFDYEDQYLIFNESRAALKNMVYDDGTLEILRYVI